MLNFYQTGVAKTFQDLGVSSITSFAGASAGAGLGVLLAQGSDAEEIASVAIEILKPYAHKNILTNPSIIHNFADEFLKHFITDSTLHKINGRVFISITALKPFKNLVINQFYDKKDLSKAIRSSCHIPSVRKRSVGFRGMRCVDGGFTNNGPIIDVETIRVSPFFFEKSADIYPQKRIAPWKALIVPSEDAARELFVLGQNDGLRFIHKIQNNGKIKRKKPSKITPFPFAQVKNTRSSYSI